MTVTQDIKLAIVGSRDFTDFQVVRYRRNDIETLGVMTTSAVESISDRMGASQHCGCAGCSTPFQTFETANSVYRLDFLPDDAHSS